MADIDIIKFNLIRAR